MTESGSIMPPCRQPALERGFDTAVPAVGMVRPFSPGHAGAPIVEEEQAAMPYNPVAVIHALLTATRDANGRQQGRP